MAFRTTSATETAASTWRRSMVIPMTLSAKIARSEREAMATSVN